MNEEEFIEALKATPFTWKISGFGVLRTREKPYACPICAVFNHRQNRDPNNALSHSVSAANMTLKLSPRLKRTIMYAADGHIYGKAVTKMKKTLIKATNPTIA